MTDTGTRWIVVGYDGSQHAEQTLAWAVAWAAERGHGVRVLTAYRPDQSGTRTPARARAELDRVVGAHVDGLPAHRITGELVDAHPVEALVEASREAVAVVVGTRGAGGWRGLLAGSVAADIAAHAHSPVIVVPARTTDTGARGPVAVGLDGSPESLAAAEFAFEQADRWGVPLVAVHAWETPRLLAPALLDGDSSGLTAQAMIDTVNRETLEALAERHPTVRLDHRSLSAPAVATLASLSDVASLVVVGSRGRGGFAGLLLGSTSRSLMQASRCPVAIIRTPARD